MSVTIGHTDTPDTGRLQGAERFRLKLSGPAWKTPKWLSLNVGDALAYKWYIIFVEERDSAATRVFTWYTHSNKKTYLQDQDGNWLSYEALYGVLKVTLWGSAAAWALPSNRLVVDGGNVLTYDPNQKWPWSTTTRYLSVAPEGSETVTVEWEYVT